MEDKFASFLLTTGLVICPQIKNLKRGLHSCSVSVLTHNSENSDFYMTCGISGCFSIESLACTVNTTAAYSQTSVSACSTGGFTKHVTYRLRD